MTLSAQNGNGRTSDSARRSTLVTGGAGFIGTPLCLQLVRDGRRVRALDSLMHGQEAVAGVLEAAGVEVVRGDVRDPAARARALDGIDDVVHLAAIVGDPACKRDPELSHSVNVDAARALIRDMVHAGTERLVFASTCSNYGKMADPEVLVTEESELAPVSLYAEQKVEIEHELLRGSVGGLIATCLRFATVYGISPRMRFDLTVNEFTRDLWEGRELQVFGEQFWRPYIHVQDVAAAVALVLDQESAKVAGAVFNVGSTEENYTKLGVIECIRKHVASGEVEFVPRVEDPRDYRVSFERIARELGFVARTTVPDGVQELVSALAAGAFPDTDATVYRN